MSNFLGFATPQECEQPYTVSEINNGIANIIESQNTLVWVEGEISNYKRASSGHIYLKLKDIGGQIPAVIWKSNASKLDFIPEDGLAVLVIASIRVYTKGGYYQLDIHKIQPIGEGFLYLAYEKLKNKLESEGLFDSEHKQPIPESVTRIGVVTAKTGAVIRDIQNTISRRSPQTTILIRPVSVQGDSAPAQIVNAINDFNEYGNIDCMIVGRGGGSVEDLMAFNDERVARAIFKSKIPIISAVGHEIDFTIADFVADVRAPTPSAAAEIAVSDQLEMERFYLALKQRFAYTFNNYLNNLKQQFNTIKQNYTYSSNKFFTGKQTEFDLLVQRYLQKKPTGVIYNARQFFDNLQNRMFNYIEKISSKNKTKFSLLTSKLNALSPLNILARGYSVVSDGKITIKDYKQLSINQSIKIKFHNGSASATITEIEKESSEKL